MNYKNRQKLKRCLPVFLTNILKGLKDIFDKRPQIVYNIGKDINNKHKALLCYVPNFLFFEDLDTVIGTREKECSAFVHALISSECSVDICYVDYNGPILSDYDYIFGQGLAFRNARKQNPHAKSILYLTEMPPSYSFAKEKERAEYLFQRHQIKVNFARSGKYFIESDFDGLDGCIMMGKEEDASLVKGTSMYMIRPTGLKNHSFRLEDRKIEESKNNFIWIGSYGSVHKGLDILFDVFAKHPELTLHVLGLQPQERKLLKSIMPHNIVDYGFVQISTDEFLNIATKCAFMIYPSCSEGVATSVITAMNHGIIPLVSEVCSIETEGCGESMKSFYVEDVEKVVLKWYHKSNDELREKMQKTIDVAQQWYTLEKYSESIHRLVEEIVK